MTEYYQNAEFRRFHDTPIIGELEHVINFGCTSFTACSDGITYYERNKRIEYSDEELKYCIRKYGSFRVFRAKARYNFRRKLFFGAWWVCHLFGLELYSKNEVMAAVYSGIGNLRNNSNIPLEEQIIKNLEFQENTTPRSTKIIQQPVLPSVQKLPRGKPQIGIAQKKDQQTIRIDRASKF